MAKTNTEEDIAMPAMFPELKPASQLIFGATSSSAIKTKKSQRTRPAKAAAAKASFSSHMVGASPLTLGAVAYPRSSRRGSGLPGSAVASSLVGPDANRNLLHYPPTQSAVPGPIPHGDAPHKVRKIPKHPYIEASSDGVWVDGDTGLEYLTDLSDYLGHDRKETGRHTLMGVGQYTRTVFKIKVRCYLLWNLQGKGCSLLFQYICAHVYFVHRPLHSIESSSGLWVRPLRLQA